MTGSTAQAPAWRLAQTHAKEAMQQRILRAVACDGSTDGRRWCDLSEQLAPLAHSGAWEEGLQSPCLECAVDARTWGHGRCFAS